MDSNVKDKTREWNLTRGKLSMEDIDEIKQALKRLDNGREQVINTVTNTNQISSNQAGTVTVSNVQAQVLNITVNSNNPSNATISSGRSTSITDQNPESNKPRNNDQPTSRDVTEKQYGVPSQVKTFSWDSLIESAKDTVDFKGDAWFCQAKTLTGKTECSLGNRPPKPGCYVMVSQDKTTWIAVDDAAEKLGLEYHSPKNKKSISAKSGYGCGTPRSGDWWLVVDIP